MATNPNQSVLDANQLAALQQTVSNYSQLQLAWASGYLAGKSEVGGSPVVAEATSAPAATLTVLYSSQTGNAKGVATQFAELAKTAGINVNVKNIADYKAKSLKSETHLVIVTSTNGEGAPPDDALEFHEFLLSKKAPKLANLKYGVLALGDTSYEFFCQTGKDFDNRLKELGATAVIDRADCDVDYEDDANIWSVNAINALKEELSSASAPVATGVAPVALAVNQYTKQKPYTADLLVSQKLTGRDSAKDVRHIEIDLGESGLTYQPGDALGVWFENSAALVDELLSLLKFDDSTEVSLKISGQKETVKLRDALVSHLEITQTPLAFIDFWTGASQSQELLAIVQDKDAVRQFAATNQIVDVVKQYPAEVDAQAFVDVLRKITPRLYSIASSQAEVDEEVHLTVGLVTYQKDGVQRFGGASGFLAQEVNDDSKVKVFVEHNDNFRLPENGDTPVIMIGPGTGVAPFRAFMQEREATDAQGDNWMFFGDQTFTQDFLYQVEWQNYLKSGLLTKMDVAFSRDQAEKIYVQDRIQENAAEVFAWLERGAHVYICGDMSRMAKDVEATLVKVISEQGKLSQEQATEYLKDLRNAKRYQKDVY